MNSEKENGPKKPLRVYHGDQTRAPKTPIATPKVKLPDPMRPNSTAAPKAAPVRKPALASSTAGTQRPQTQQTSMRRELGTGDEIDDDAIQMNDTIHTEQAAPKGRKPNKRYSMPRSRPSIGSASATKPGTQKEIPEVAEGNYRIIPLGGVEEIGMNMTVIESKDDIIVIDAGFGFGGSTTPGIDYILPNTKYLEERKHKIRAIIVTHGHLDHIGALPYIMEKIGMPPVYTRNLTAFMIKKRQSEFPQIPQLDYRIVEGNETLKLGNMTIKFYGVTHSIPDSLGIIIDTPYGWITTPGDFKLDHVDTIPTKEEEKNYELFDGKNVMLLLGESTNIENPGFSTPESIVHENLAEIVKNMNGRLIMGMFASHAFRIAKVIEACETYGKKLVIEGRSMKNNVDILMQAGLVKVNKGTIITAQEMSHYAPDKIVVLATGAQGDEFGALMRMSNKQHKYVILSDKDTVLLSSSIIPGNEKVVQKMKDNIARAGTRIIHYRTSDVYIHATGHANRGEIEWLHRKLRPRFFMPMHGNHYHLRLHAELANNLGIPKENIVVPDDCNILEIQDGGTKFVKLAVKAPDNVVMVDGFTVGDIQDVVLRDRQILAEDGIFVVVAMMNPMTGRLIKSPDIISRGSVYLRESQELLREIRTLVRNTIERAAYTMRPPNIDYIKDLTADTLGKFIFQETAKRPIIIPVVLLV
jgi:ribonuclease J